MTKTTSPAGPVLDAQALSRATLARQLLLSPAELSVKAAVEHLLGLQAQNARPPYYALAARLEGFAPEQLSALMADRGVVRIVTMRSTIRSSAGYPRLQPGRESGTVRSTVVR
ncbi:crosslink repair DNA glycosylase YcaQ family protein [Streptomyces sp. B21-105]|uniref:DNA glycosylase AlkZ-like family protein n=1 Tax=Streptomyces sp. B21-105 TaxID=3039417 RepID=UPI002FF0F954